MVGESAAAPVTVEEEVAEEAAAAWLAAWPGGDLDAKDEAGWSALQRAAEAGQAAVVAELLRATAAPPLLAARWRGRRLKLGRPRWWTRTVAAVVGIAGFW